MSPSFDGKKMAALLFASLFLISSVALFSFSSGTPLPIPSTSESPANVHYQNINFTGNVTNDFRGDLVYANYNATFWGSSNNLTDLYVSYNSTYLYIGVGEIVDGNAIYIFLSNNTNSGLGTYNITNLNTWSRNIVFTKPMNYFFSIWSGGLNSGVTGYGMFAVNSSVSASNSTPTAENITSSNSFVFGSNNSLELRIPWKSLDLVPGPNVRLNISAFIVGGSGAWLGTGMPYSQVGHYNAGSTYNYFTVSNTLGLKFLEPTTNLANITFTGNVSKDFSGHLLYDNTNRSYWGNGNNISDFFGAYNSTDLFLGADENISNNWLYVFLSNDTGSQYGTMNISNLSQASLSRSIIFSRPINYIAVSGFGASNSNPSGYATYYVGSQVNSSNISANAVPVTSNFVFSGKNNSTEIAIPWASLFPSGYSGSLDMGISAFVVGGSSSWVGTGIPFPQVGPYSTGNTMFMVNNTISFTVGYISVSPSTRAPTYPISLNIIFNDHQPLYKIVGSNFYQLPWTQAHATAEYIEQPLIAGMFPGINVTYQLSGSLLYQLVNISSDPYYNNTYIADSFIPFSELNTTQNISELNNITSYYFNTPEYVYGLGEPASNLYSSIHLIWESGKRLNATQFEDAKVLWFLYDISTPLLEGKLGAQWINSTIWSMHNQTVFSQSDLITILHYSQWLTGQVIMAFKSVEMTGSGGNVELITSPFYHPLVPLLLANNFSGPQGTIYKSSYMNDTIAQFEYGKGQFQYLFGTTPSGVWMPESAVSNQTVEALNLSGYQWTQSSEFTLQQSGVDAMALGNTGSNATTMEHLYTPYKVLGPTGTSTIMFFRDDVLSNAWAFNYGGLPTSVAVSDFINYLKSIYYTIPMNDHNNTLVTVAMDGENWMFMSPFALDGVPFLEQLYKALEDNSSFVHTVTPSQYLSTHHNLPTINNLADGSWNQGNGVAAPYQSITSFTQWSGYPVQDFYWMSLNAVRNTVLKYQTANDLVQLSNYTAITQNLSANTPEGNITRAWNALYAAEGSDWFFTVAPWDISGSNTVPFDQVFKGDLIYALEQIGSPIPDYLMAHQIPPIQPTSEGQPNTAHTPTINGYPETSEATSSGSAFSVTQNNGWQGSTVYENNSSVSGALSISQVDITYNPTDLFVQVIVNGNASSYINSNTQRLALYFSGPGLDVMQGNVMEDVPFANFGTQFGNTILNFPISTMVELSPYNFLPNGAGQYSVYKSGGFGTWNYQTGDINTIAYVVKSIQFAIPLSYLGVVPGDSFYLAVVASTLSATSSAFNPIMVSIPASLATFTPISTIKNTVPDNGPGNYTYPNQPTQIPPGSLDMQFVNVSLNNYDMEWNFTFGQMWNIWSGPNGFSNQIIGVYISESNGTGSESLGMGPNANSTVPWQYMIYVSGWATYVASYNGQQYTSGVISSANFSSRTISVVVPLSVIGNSVENYKYIIISGSYDGYGVQGWRTVDAVNTTNGGWQGGGGDPPWSSNIYDYIAPATVGEGSLTQQQALTYSPGKIPTLTPIALPLLSSKNQTVPFNSTEYYSPSIARIYGVYYLAYISNVTGVRMVYISQSVDLQSWNLLGSIQGTEGATAVSLSTLNSSLFVTYSVGNNVNVARVEIAFPQNNAQSGNLIPISIVRTLNLTYSSYVSTVSTSQLGSGKLAILANLVSGVHREYDLTVASSSNGKMTTTVSKMIGSGDSNATVASNGTSIFVSFYNTSPAGTLYLYTFSSQLAGTGTYSMNNFTGAVGNLGMTAMSGQEVIIAFSRSINDEYTISVVNHTGSSHQFGSLKAIISNSEEISDPAITTIMNGKNFSVVASWEQKSSTGYGIWAANTSIVYSLSTLHVTKPTTPQNYLIPIAISIVVIAIIAGAVVIYLQRKKR